jgi:hypothetical protein
MSDIDTNHRYADREAWFSAAMTELAPYFTEVGHPLPEGKIRVSVGFGPTGARKENSKVLGVCLTKLVVKDGVTEIWISPEHAGTAQMLGTLVHELIHAVLNQEDAVVVVEDEEAPVEAWNRHDTDFAELGTRLGLEGTMSHSVSGADLNMKLELIAASLGEYPGAQVDLNMIKAKVPAGPEGMPEPKRSISSGPKTQTTRQLKVACVNPKCGTYNEDKEEGYIVRVSAKWLQIGYPICPGCNTPMS